MNISYSHTFSPSQYIFAEHHGRAAIHGIDDAVSCWAFSTTAPNTLEQRIFTKKISGREPPLGDIVWVDDEHLLFIDAKRKESKLTLYSTDGKRISSIKLPGYITGPDDICSDGETLYVLSHEDAQRKKHSTLSIVRIIM